MARRWRHGGSRQQWAELAASGQFKALYRERHLLDRATRAALSDLPWPVRREAATAALVAAGDDALDQLLRAAAPPPPPLPPLPPRSPAAAAADVAGPEAAAGAAGTGGSSAARRGDPDLLLGRRYWAEQALAAVRKRQAAVALAEAVRLADPVEGLERGALAIAQAHYPAADTSRLEAELAALGALMRRRMEAAGAAPGSLQALHILNHMLFSPPENAPQQPLGFPPASPSAAPASTAAAAAPPPSLNLSAHELRTLYSPSPVSSPRGPPAAASASASAWSSPRPSTSTSTPAAPAPAAPASTFAAACPPLAAITGEAGGLGLRGCEETDYHSATNSLLPDVLSYRRRRGIPIALAAVQLAVARRGGLGGRLELIGLPARVVTRFIPSDDNSSGTGGSSPPTPQRSPPQQSQQQPQPGEVFVDVFGGGRVLTWEELRTLMAAVGVALGRHHVRPLSTAQSLERMAANLYSIYRDAGDMPCLRLMLELAGVVAERPRDLLPRRYRVSLALEDWTDAAECLTGMGEGVLQQQQQAEQQQHPQQAGAGAGAPAGGAGAGAAGAAGGGGGGAAEGGGHMRQQLAAHMARLRRDLDERRSEWQAGSVSQKHRQRSAVHIPVGTMMQHRAYGYRGVIVDWDPNCCMDEQWIVQMGVDALPGGGRNQPFYRVLVSDREGEGEAGGREGGAAGGDGEAGRNGAAGEAAAGAGAADLQQQQQQTWLPFGPSSNLRGLHNKPRSEETYVAQVNVHVLLPTLPPRSQSHAQLGAAEAEAEARGAAAPPGGPLGGWQPPVGVPTVAVPQDFQIQHPELGRYLLGRPLWAPRYCPNAALRHRFPADDWGVHGCGGGGDEEEEAEEEDWQGEANTY